MLSSVEVAERLYKPDHCVIDQEVLKAGRIEEVTNVDETHHPGKLSASLDRLDGNGIRDLSPALGKFAKLCLNFRASLTIIY